MKPSLKAILTVAALTSTSLLHAQTPVSTARLKIEVKTPVVVSEPKPSGSEPRPPGYPPSYHTKCWGDKITYTFNAKISGVADASVPLKVRVVLIGRAPKPGPQRENAVQFETRKLQEVTKEVPVGSATVDIPAQPISEWKCSCRIMNVKYETYYAELLQGNRIIATDAPEKGNSSIQKVIEDNATKL